LRADHGAVEILDPGSQSDLTVCDGVTVSIA
jgi:hypothetical protein